VVSTAFRVREGNSALYHPKPRRPARAPVYFASMVDARALQAGLDSQLDGFLPCQWKLSKTHGVFSPLVDEKKTLYPFVFSSAGHLRFVASNGHSGYLGAPRTLLKVVQDIGTKSKAIRGSSGLDRTASPLSLCTAGKTRWKHGALAIPDAFWTYFVRGPGLCTAKLTN